jgi:hypothetical protein
MALPLLFLHPLPLAAIKGAHPHRGAPFLPPPPFAPYCAAIPTAAKPPWTAHSSLSPTDLTTPRAPRHHIQPPHTASCRPPPPDATPTSLPLQPTTPHRRAHSSGALLPCCHPKMGPPPYCLAPRTLPATPRRRAPPESDRAATSAAVAERPPLSH